MSISTTINNDKTVCTIKIDGKFDFNLLSDFRHSYSDISENTAQVIVDLRSTSSIDSSALGMLLNMQRHLNKNDKEIRIINCNENVKKVLNITHFDKKFMID